MNKIINIFLRSGSKSDPSTIRYIARPFATILSRPLINKVSANNITYFRSILIVFTLLFMCLGNILLFKVAAFLIIINTILDCVDGDIARKTDTASYWGKFIDGFIDSFIYALIPLAGAINILIYTNTKLVPILLILASIFSLIEHSLMSRLSFYREWIKNNEIKYRDNNYFMNPPKFILTKSFFDIHHTSAILAIFILSPLFYFIVIAFCNITVSSIRIFMFINQAYTNINIYKKSSFKSVEESIDKKN